MTKSPVQPNDVFQKASGLTTAVGGGVTEGALHCCQTMQAMDFHRKLVATFNNYQQRQLAQALIPLHLAT